MRHDARCCRGDGVPPVGARLRASRQIGVGLISFELAACASSAASSAPRAPSAAEHQALVAQRCTAVSPPAGTVDKAKARVLVEVAQLTTPDLPRPIGDWLEHHPVDYRAVSSLLTADGVPSSTEWSGCLDADCDAPQTARLTVITHLPEVTSDLIRFEIRIEPSPASDALLATVETTDQQALLLDDVGDPQVHGRLVVMPYLMSSPEELQKLMECRQRQSKAVHPGQS
jgi:hypothetical protein